MAQTAAQQASVAAQVAKVKAANAAKAGSTTQTTTNAPTTVAPTTAVAPAQQAASTNAPQQPMIVKGGAIETANAIESMTSGTTQKPGALEYARWDKNQPNNQLKGMSQPQAQNSTQQQQPSNVVFGQQAQQQQAVDSQYLDKRNTSVAEQINNQLTSMAKSGQRITGATRDQVIQQIISQNGGNIDINNPDWVHTLDAINAKVLGMNKASSWDSLYSGLNRNMDKIGKYTDAQTLYTAVNNNSVTSEQLDLIKSTNPALYNEYKTLQDNKIKLATINNKKPDDTISNINAVLEGMGIDSSTSHVDLLAKRDELFNAPDVKESTAKYQADKAELLKLQDIYANVEADVRKQYEGTGATESYIQAMIAKQQKPIYTSMQTAQRNLALSQEDYSIKIANAKDSLGLFQQQIQLDQQERSAKMQEAGFAMNVLSFETPAQKDERAWNNYIKEQDYTNGNINSKDPTVRQKAIEKSVDSVLKEFDGIPITRSRDQIVSDIQRMVDSGTSLGDAITENLRKPIMGKTEYKVWANNKLGIDSKPYSMGNGLIGIPDGKGGYTYTTEQAFKDQYTPPNQVINQLNSQVNQERAINGASQYDDVTTASSIKSQYLGQNCGVQCAGFTNKLASELGMNLGSGSTLDAKIASMKQPGIYSPLPVVGGFVTLDTGTPNGHTGYVTAVNGNKITVLNSNYYGTADNPKNVVTENTFDISKVRAATIAPGKPSISTGGTSGTAPTAAEIAMYQKGAQYIGKDNGLTPTRYNQIDAYIKKNTTSADNNLLKSSSGGKIISSTEASNLAQGVNLPSVVGALEKLVDENNSLFGPVRGYLSSKNPYDTKTQTINAQLKTASQMVGKFMEGGVLRKEDEVKYQAMLPNISDTPDVAKAKIQNVITTLKQTYDSYLTSFAQGGYDVSGYKYMGDTNSSSSSTNASRAVVPSTSASTSPGLYSNNYSWYY